MTPHPYQVREIEHLASVFQNRKAGVNGSDMGTGKTLMAVELIRRLGDPSALVIAPKATLPSWRRHGESQGVGLDAVNWELVRLGRTPYGTWDGDDFKWHPGVEFLVFDEVHRAIGKGTKNARLVKAARDQGIRCLMQSATLADTPLEMDAIGYVLGLHDGFRPKVTLRRPDPVSFNKWLTRHGCRFVMNEWFFSGSEAARNEVMRRIHGYLYPERGVRIRISELGDQFPDQQITAELFGTEDKGRVDALYANMTDALAVLAQKREGDFGSAQVALLRAMQELELIKVPILVDQAKESLDAGRKVALFVKFRQTVEELCSRLNTQCLIDGSQAGDAGARRREENRLDFVEDRSRTIVCNIEAGGVGLDLGDLYGRFPVTSLVSPGFNAKSARQVPGRTRRANSVSKSLVRFVFIDETEEMHIHASLSRKLNDLDALNDGDLYPQNLRITATL